MYGRYTRDLGDYAKEEAKKIKQTTKLRHEGPGNVFKDLILH